MPALFALVATPASLADVINVPAEQPTIQAGIDAAVNGDEVVVAPGTYGEIIDFSGKAITVRSSVGAGGTTIDATGVPDPGEGRPVVRFDSGEGPGSALEGFTVTGGTGDTLAFGVSLGAGVFINGASPTIRDCEIVSNSASNAGGVFISQGSADMRGCLIEDNSAVEVSGGGIFLFDSSSLTLEGCTVRGNNALSTGGGLIIDSGPGTITIRDTVFEDNSALDGAGINVSNLSGSITIERSTFRDNISTGNFGGGAVQLSGPSTVRIANSSFIDNSAQGSGARGGAINGLRSGAVLVNCAFSGNSADTGGAVLMSNDAVITNCSFSGNSSPNGSAVGVGGLTESELNNCAFWGNSGSAPVVNLPTIPPGPDPVLNHCLVEGGWAGPGTGNIDADPLFLDGANDDLRLLPGSPAIDAGDTPTVAGVAGSSDLAGATRLTDDPGSADTGVPAFGLTIDIGAFEFPVVASPVGCSIADVAAPLGVLDFNDVIEFLTVFGAGCP